MNLEVNQWVSGCEASKQNVVISNKAVGSTGIGIKAVSVEVRKVS